MPPAGFIAAVGATIVVSGLSRLTALVPSTVKPGDTLLFVVAGDDITTGDVAPSSLPAGWSVLARLATATRVCNVLRRIATVTEPPSHTIATIGVTGLPIPIAGVLLVYRGLDAGAAVVDGGIVDVGFSTAYAKVGCAPRDAPNPPPACSSNRLRAARSPRGMKPAAPLPP